MTRYLRIAAAVTFALLACALIGLWVRSYYRVDIVTAPLGGTYGIYLSTGRGRALCEVRHLQVLSSEKWSHWSHPAISNAKASRWQNGILCGLGFEVEIVTGSYYVMMPYWFLTLPTVALAALFTFKRTWRFTIRALLIATTLIAGALGLGVYVL